MKKFLVGLAMLAALVCFIGVRSWFFSGDATINVSAQLQSENVQIAIAEHRKASAFMDELLPLLSDMNSPESARQLTPRFEEMLAKVPVMDLRGSNLPSLTEDQKKAVLQSPEYKSVIRKGKEVGTRLAEMRKADPDCHEYNYVRVMFTECFKHRQAPSSLKQQVLELVRNGN